MSAAFDSFGEKRVAAISRAVLQKVNRQHDKHGRLQERLPEWHFFARVELAGFGAERRFKMLALLV